MTNIYISSTFTDLVQHRTAVIRALRQMDKVVIAMEDYTASDERPLERCLGDVARCDVYVGIFGYRYGFIPKNDNPERLSITEREYRHAAEVGKQKFVFLAEGKNGWPLQYADAFTGEGEAGKRIDTLRAELSDDKMIRFFTGPDDLATSVTTAIAAWQEKQHPMPAAAAGSPLIPGPHPRELRYDLFLAHSPVDDKTASDLTEYFHSAGLRVKVDSQCLFAETPSDFQKLEISVRECGAAAVLISDISLNQLEERLDTAFVAIRLVRDRAASAVALCVSDTSYERVTAWQLLDVENVTDWQPRQASPPPSLDARLRLLGSQSFLKCVGLPVVVVAMNGKEAQQLEQDPDIVSRELGGAAQRQFTDLRTAVNAPLASRYGPNRTNWRPFGPAAPDIATLLADTVRLVNESQALPLKGRLIKPQSYPLEGILDDSALLRPIINELSSSGCVVILDEYSLFHPRIQSAFVSSALFGSEQVALVTISPANPYASAPFVLIEAELNRRLAAAFDRFASAYDPQCELSVGDAHRFRRWLHGSLPRTVQMLRDPRPNRQRILEFASQLGSAAEPRVGTLLYSEGLL
jgi:hypothetical protein